MELDLSENLLREVPSEAWRHTRALMRINLAANPIKLIRDGAFSQLQVTQRRPSPNTRSQEAIMDKVQQSHLQTKLQ